MKNSSCINIKIIFILIFAALAQVGAGQNPQWLVYTSSNSPLPSNDVGSIVIDRNNVKWIGTSNGLVRLQGNNWIIFDTTNSPLPTNNIVTKAIDSLNNLWISLPSFGIAKFDGSNWNLYDTSNSGLPSNNVVSIAIDRNNVKWIGALGGVVKFNDTNWIIYNSGNSGLPNNAIGPIALEDNLKWIGTKLLSGGMAKFNDSSWVIYNTSNSGLPSNVINDIEVDFQNQKWICTDFGGLVKYNNFLNTWTIFNTKNSEIPSNFCYAVVSHKHLKYIGTPLGVGKFNDANWQVFNEINSPLPNNTVPDIKADSFGNIWIATLGGVAVYNESGIVAINNREYKIVSDFILHQNYPNPFNVNTIIEYEVKKNSIVKITLYDVTGKEIDILINSFHHQGKYKISYDANKLSSGIYFYKLQTEGFFISKIFTLIK